MAESRLRLLPGLKPFRLVHPAYAHRVTAGTEVAKAEEMARSRHLLEQTTKALAGVLEAAGIQTRRHCPGLSFYGVDTETVRLEESRWKDWMFLPSVQVVARAAQRAELGAYLQAHPKGQYARLWVVTTGPRCTISEVSARLTWLHRAVRHLARWFEQHDVELVVRQDELTIDGRGRAHVHGNLVLIPHKAFGSKAWSVLLDEARDRFFGGNWTKDCGVLGDVNEAVKYCTKFTVVLAEDYDPTADPKLTSEAQADALRDSIAEIAATQVDDPSDHPIVQLHQALLRRKTFQPYGSFRGFCRALDERRLKVWSDPRAVADPTLSSGRYVLIQRAEAATPAKGGSGKPLENWLLATTLPWALNGRTIEPVALVINYTSNPQTMEGKRGLATLQGLREFLRADPQPESPSDQVSGDASSIVHTSGFSAQSRPPPIPLQPPLMAPPGPG